MLPIMAALKIQKFFKDYSLSKKAYLEEIIRLNPAQAALFALNLRFKCMKIVAAAKLSIHKSIEDNTQISKVIESLLFLANEQGINDNDKVINLCLSNITIAENIQKPYYYNIWTKSYHNSINFSVLLENSYKELCEIIINNNLPILITKKEIYLANEVLDLAREIIQYASKLMLISLTDTRTTNYFYENTSKIIEIISVILSNYMTPTELQNSKKPIEMLVETIKTF